MVGARIAIFTPNLGGGGAERTVLDMAAGIVRYGTPVDVVVVNAVGPLLDSVPAGVRLIELKAFRVEVCHFSLLRYLVRRRPKALISTLFDADIVALGVKKYLHRDFKLIVRTTSTTAQAMIHLPFKARVSIRLWRWLLPAADAVVANSVGVAEDLRSCVRDIDRTSLRRIHGAVVWPYIAEKAREALHHPWFDGTSPVLLAAGRLVPYKGYETTLRAFAEVVKARPARLVILGEGPDRARLKALTDTLKIGGLVDFAGYQANPFAYMARAAVFVHASSLEGLPNVLIQAMACGTPVVSTDCPCGPREILAGGKWGPLVPMGDWRALAAAISRTLDAQPDRDALVAAAERYDGQSSVDQYMELLRELNAVPR